MQKPRISRCGNHWAVDWYSVLGDELPVWECVLTWDDALKLALLIAVKHKALLKFMRKNGK